MAKEAGDIIGWHSMTLDADRRSGTVAGVAVRVEDGV
jgi:hypothetical protein